MAISLVVEFGLNGARVHFKQTLSGEHLTWSVSLFSTFESYPTNYVIREDGLSFCSPVGCVIYVLFLSHILVLRGRLSFMKLAASSASSCTARRRMSWARLCKNFATGSQHQDFTADLESNYTGISTHTALLEFNADLSTCTGAWGHTREKPYLVFRYIYIAVVITITILAVCMIFGGSAYRLFSRNHDTTRLANLDRGFLIFTCFDFLILMFLFFAYFSLTGLLIRMRIKNVLRKVARITLSFQLD
jgi:hypothetical protein